MISIATIGIVPTAGLMIIGAILIGVWNELGQY